MLISLAASRDTENMKLSVRITWSDPICPWWVFLHNTKHKSIISQFYTCFYPTSWKLDTSLYNGWTFGIILFNHWTYGNTLLNNWTVENSIVQQLDSWAQKCSMVGQGRESPAIKQLYTALYKGWTVRYNVQSLDSRTYTV